MKSLKRLLSVTMFLASFLLAKEQANAQYGQPSCPCAGTQYAKLSLYYSGPDGKDIQIYRKSDLTQRVASFSNVQSGTMLQVNVGNRFNGKLKNWTYIAVGDSANPCTLSSGGQYPGNSCPLPHCVTDIPTRCTDRIVGKTYGHFFVVSWGDKFGNSCDLCDTKGPWVLGGNVVLEDCNVLGSINNVDVKLITNSNERMRITKDGNIGIHTSTPTTELDIDGELRVRSVGVDNSLQEVLVVDQQGVLKRRQLDSIVAAQEGDGLSFDAANQELDVNVDSLTMEINAADALAVKDAGIGNVKLAPDAVTTDKILDGTISLADIGQNGAGSGEVMVWNGTAWVPGSNDDADADAANELQTISKAGNTVTLSKNGGSFIDEVDDADADAANELQMLSKAGNVVSLSNNGGSFIDEVDDADADAANELQTISKAGNTVTLSNNGGSFTDEVDDADADAANELQTLSKSGNTVTLSNNGGSVSIDDNDWTVSGSDIVRSSGNVGINVANPTARMHIDGSIRWAEASAPIIYSDPNATGLPASDAFRIRNDFSFGGGTSDYLILEKTDSNDSLPDGGIAFLMTGMAGKQDTSLIIRGTGNTPLIGIGTAEPSERLDVDGNIRIRSIPQNNSLDRVLVSNANGQMHYRDASTFVDGDGDASNELQTLSKSGNTVTLSNNGGTFTDEVNDADADASNELQTLSKSGNTVTLSNNGGTFTDEVNDADADASNELQTLSKSGNTVTLSNNGGTFTDEVNDADADASNELQTLSKSGTTLSLSNNGGSVSLDDNDWTVSGNNVVRTTGNVGINVSNPQARMHIDGPIRWEEGGGPILYSDPAASGTPASDAFRINYEPSFLGSVTDYLIIEKTDANDDINPDGGIAMVMTDKDGDRQTALIIRGNSSVNGTPTRVGVLTNNPTHDFSVNGDASKTGGGSWSSFSDRRLKKDIKEFEFGLETLKRVMPKTFRYNGKGGISDTETEFVGVIAQELREVAPYMVSEVVVQGTEGTESETYLSVDPSAFDYLLINSIQEQQATIEALAQKIAQLEALINGKGGKPVQIENNDVQVKPATPTSPSGAPEPKNVLEQNRPNPFSGTTMISYTLAQPGQVSLEVFSKDGHHVATLVNAPLEAGQYQTEWDASGMQSGVYIYKLKVNDQELARKMIHIQ